MYRRFLITDVKEDGLYNREAFVLSFVILCFGDGARAGAISNYYCCVAWLFL